MNRYIQNLMGLSAVGALSILGWAGFEAGRAIQENRPAIRAASAGAQSALSPTGAGVPTLFNEARDITIAMLKPCKPGKPETCGLIPSIRSVAVDAGSAVRTMGDQVKETQPLITAAAEAVRDTSTHANKAIDKATEATEQARADLQTLNGSISASRPLLEAYTRAGDSLNEILKRQAINRILENTASMTESGAGILADAKKETDSMVAPKTTRQKVFGYLPAGVKLGAVAACLATGTPCP